MLPDGLLTAFYQADQPHHTAQHYLGYGESVARILEQRAGSRHAARLCQVAKERGIDFVVARIWEEGDRTLERKLKNRKNAPRLCPICNGAHTDLLSLDIDFDLVANR